jgi:redox-sensitive bicupin YhaK (pirin superfamily)
MKTATKLVTRSHQRGHTEIGWLNSRHSFSFGDFYDPERMGFGPLRVLNDDWIKNTGKESAEILLFSVPLSN